MKLPLNNCEVTSVYGIWRTIKGVRSLHKGIDLISTSEDKNVKAIRSGVVRVTPYNKDGFGNYISVQQEDGFRALYCHLEKVLVKPGDIIEEGQVIGIEGDTGNSTGVHLHLELRKAPYDIDDHINVAEYLGINNEVGNVTYIQNYELLEFLGIMDFWRQGYKGKGITIASRESENTKHGEKVAELLKMLVPESNIIVKEDYKDEINDFNIYTTSLSYGSDAFAKNVNKAKELYNQNKFLVCAVGNHAEESQTAISKNKYFQSIGACKLKNGVPKREYYSSITDDIDFMCLTNFKLSSGIFNGTSCAGPVFASMVDYIQQISKAKVNRLLTNAELLNFIKDNLIDLEEEGHDLKTGHGLFILPKPWKIDYSKYLDEEEEEMSVIKRLIEDYGEEFVEEYFRTELEKKKNKNEVPSWADEKTRAEFEEAKSLGITDGSRPQDNATRFETAIMIKRTAQK